MRLFVSVLRSAFSSVRLGRLRIFLLKQRSIAPSMCFLSFVALRAEFFLQIILRFFDYLAPDLCSSFKRNSLSCSLCNLIDFGMCFMNISVFLSLLKVVLRIP